MIDKIIFTDFIFLSFKIKFNYYILYYYLGKCQGFYNKFKKKFKSSLLVILILFEEHSTIPTFPA